MKKWYQSKTVWVNVIMGVLVMVQWAFDQQWIPAAAEGGIILAANLILRGISGEPITFTGKAADTTKSPPQ